MCVRVRVRVRVRVHVHVHVRACVRACVCVWCVFMCVLVYLYVCVCAHAGTGSLLHTTNVRMRCMNVTINEWKCTCVHALIGVQAEDLRVLRTSVKELRYHQLQASRVEIDCIADDRTLLVRHLRKSTMQMPL